METKSFPSVHLLGFFGEKVKNIKCRLISEVYSSKINPTLDAEPFSQCPTPKSLSQCPAPPTKI